MKIGNGLGSVTALSHNGIVVERYKYDPFGITTVCDGSGTPLTSNESAYGNRFMFTGREYDDETKLYYYRARMYSPGLGRFMQPDPISYYDSMNLYQYCGNNPVNFIDPWGLCSQEGTGGAGGWIIGKAAGEVEGAAKNAVQRQIGRAMRNEMPFTRPLFAAERLARRELNRLIPKVPTWWEVVTFFTLGPGCTMFGNSYRTDYCPVCGKNGNVAVGCPCSRCGYSPHYNPRDGSYDYEYYDEYEFWWRQGDFRAYP